MQQSRANILYQKVRYIKQALLGAEHSENRMNYWIKQFHVYFNWTVVLFSTGVLISKFWFSVF